MLALRWIAEFEVYAEEDEEDFREFKALTLRRSQYDDRAAVTLKVITEFVETVEPDPMLKRFHNWLHAKGNDPIAILVRWWLSEFEEVQEEEDRCDNGPMPTLH